MKEIGILRSCFRLRERFLSEPKRRLGKEMVTCSILIATVLGLAAGAADAEAFGIKLKDKSTVAVATPYGCKVERIGDVTHCIDVQSSIENGGQRSTSLDARYLTPNQILGSSFKREPDANEKSALGTVVALIVASTANKNLASNRNVKVLDQGAVNMLKSDVPDGFDGCATFDIDLLQTESKPGHQTRVDRSGAVCVKYDARQKRYIVVFVNVNVLRVTKGTGSQFPKRAAGLSRDAQRVLASLRNY
ncbi:hypothetical protein [Ruegeria sp. PrR005]|uniref:Uncharacterized protein n=1 Tax=Ruegeria sp. PrR005 TaxID=2706882 RepID=A0A6B2NTE1_9RHOB|nr:hypothetical protein [Ruegeria sp. PrR005]NDW47412.1 hypothetical protein [Ruegeria sp. PrR005]